MPHFHREGFGPAMSLFAPHRRSRTGYGLVLLQFGLLAGLGFLALPLLRLGQVGLTCWLLLGLSGGLGGWTLLHNRLGNFNVHPQPKAGGVLVTSGPYRWVRHPMYSTVLLIAAALACVSAQGLAWGVWLALFGVLLAKAMVEEQGLREHYPQYAAYCRQCKRFVPGVF